jgi:hypothetical protein
MSPATLQIYSWLADSNSDMGILLFAGILFFSGAQANADAISRKERALYKHYYYDTVQGFELMRGHDGLIADNIDLISTDGQTCRTQSLDEVTNPTDIALDILVQLGKMKNPDFSAEAAKNLNVIFSTLESLPQYTNGLFFSRYSTQDNQALNKNVSSVDNLHLALAFWTASNLYPGSSFGLAAQKLFSNMNFDTFYVHNSEAASTSMGGNLTFKDGKWTLDDYRYTNLGSESRSIYGIGYALKLFNSEDQFPKSAARGTYYNTTDGKDAKLGATGPMIAEWQGAFQLLLPKMLASEEKYSVTFGKFYKNFADYIIKVGKDKGYPGPAGFSACAFRTKGEKLSLEVPIYNGNAGLPELVSTANRDIYNPKARNLWDMVLTPHAVIMAATIEPSKYSKSLVQLEAVSNHEENDKSNHFPLYCKGRGFVDGVHVKDVLKGHIVRAQYSLDQGMSILAFEQILSKDGMSTSSRALHENSSTRERLLEFYKAFEEKFDSDSNLGKLSKKETRIPASH